MKLHIGVPALDHCPTPFAGALAGMMATKQTWRKFAAGDPKPMVLALGIHQGSNYCDARNALAQQALENSADAILFLDSDMVFPTDTPTRLAAHRSPIVGGTYCTRNPHGDNRVLGTSMSGDPLLLSGVAPLLPVLDLPMGCMLIRTEVFKLLPFPWFRYPMNDTWSRSEDVYFCHRAREAKYQIMCDTKLSRELGHVGQFTYRIA
jgi:hypothetical protein